MKIAGNVIARGLAVTMPLYLTACDKEIMRYQPPGAGAGPAAYITGSQLDDGTPMMAPPTTAYVVEVDKRGIPLSPGFMGAYDPQSVPVTQGRHDLTIGVLTSHGYTGITDITGDFTGGDYYTVNMQPLQRLSANCLSTWIAVTNTAGETIGPAAQDILQNNGLGSAIAQLKEGKQDICSKP